MFHLIAFLSAGLIIWTNSAAIPTHVLTLNKTSFILVFFFFNKCMPRLFGLCGCLFCYVVCSSPTCGQGRRSRRCASYRSLRLVHIVQYYGLWLMCESVCCCQIYLMTYLWSCNLTWIHLPSVLKPVKAFLKFVIAAIVNWDL